VRALAVGHIRKTLSVAAVLAQCYSLLGRLESLGPRVYHCCRQKKESRGAGKAMGKGEEG
jgi:hypothetical protein